MKKPVLYLMLGYPGSGKTTTATIISELTGAVHLWADKTRNERYPQPTHSHQENLDLYDYLNELTSKLLANGKSVVFDTGFNFYKDRKRLRQIAARHGAATWIIWVQTDNNLARKRATHPTHAKRNTYPQAMPAEQFERISGTLEEPRSDESVLAISGMAISNSSVENLLTSAGVLPGS